LSNVTSTTTETASAETTSEAVTARIRSLLGSQQFVAAKREAALGANTFPGDPWLRRADKVLNPGKAVRVPSGGTTRSAEFEWLRRNSATYRGQWVALHGAKLLAADENLEVVLKDLRIRHRDAKPLVHHVV
jgi:Family of unknown function (DUF5678)